MLLHSCLLLLQITVNDLYTELNVIVMFLFYFICLLFAFEASFCTTDKSSEGVWN